MQEPEDSINLRARDPHQIFLSTSLGNRPLISRFLLEEHLEGWWLTIKSPASTCWMTQWYSKVSLTLKSLIKI